MRIALRMVGLVSAAALVAALTGSAVGASPGLGTRPALGSTSVGRVPGVHRALGNNVNVTNKGGAQSETTVAVDPADPRHLFAASNDLTGTDTAHVYESTDAGATWALVNTGITGFCYDPWLDFNASRDVFFSYECASGVTTENVAYLKHGTATWVRTTLAGAGTIPDRDMIVLDTTSTSPFFGSAYVGYDDNGSNNKAYVFYSRDGFSGWTRSPKINDTNAPTIGVNVSVAPNGTVYATWEDINNKRLMVDASTDGGATWGTDHVVTNYRLPTPQFSIFIPPQPDRGIVPFPMSFAAPKGAAHAGRVYVVYEDRDPATADTNVYLRFSDDGVTWSAERLVNDDTTHAYQFHPRVVVNPQGIVAVSFYDTRADATNKKTERFIAFSVNGGATFGTNRKVSTAQSDESGPGDANDYGDYQGMDAANVSTPLFPMVWTDSRPGTLAEDMFFAYAHP